MKGFNVLFHLKDDSSEPVISALNDRELEQMENMRERLHQLAKVNFLCDYCRDCFTVLSKNRPFASETGRGALKNGLLNTYGCLICL